MTNSLLKKFKKKYIFNVLGSFLLVLITFNQIAFASQFNVEAVNKCKKNQINDNFIFEMFYSNCVYQKGIENMLLVNNLTNKSTVNLVNTYSNAAAPTPVSQQKADTSNYVKAPLGTLQAYNDVIFRGGELHIKVDFITPDGKSANLAPMQEPFKMAKNKLSKMVENNDPNYSWVILPEKLLKENYVDNVYKTIDEFKKPFGSDSKLIFVALGNPANTDEMAKSLGIGQNMVSSCDITPAQIKNTIKKAGGNLDKIQIIISSKSGSTFESNQTYKLLVDELTEHYKNKGIDPENIQKEISKHFLFVTDKNPEKSKLKKQAESLGIKTIDCVDGHSAFADMAYGMPALAYLGLPEQSAVKMLKSADDMSKNLMKQSNLENNMAAKIAAYDKNAATKEQFIFHDPQFTDFSTTTKQLYEESLRKLNFSTNVYPRAAHSGLETAISRGLQDQQLNNITNVVTRVNYKPNPSEETYLKEATKLEEAHIRNAQQEGHFQKNIVLEMGPDGITPESLGEFETLKSFVTYYKNEFENSGKTELYNQSYVNGYKKIREGL